MKKNLHLVSLVLLAASFLPGCIEIRRTITLQNDGSGTLVEEIRFKDQFLAMARGSQDLAALADCLKKEHLDERMSMFGEVVLVRYETEERDGVVCAAKAVFSFQDIDKIRIPAFPNRSANWPQQSVQFNLQKPVVQMGGYYGFATWFKMPLVIALKPSLRESGEAKFAEDPRTPLDKEKLRRLLPALRAMLRGFRWTLTLDAFGSVGGKESNGTSKRHVIFDVRDKDLDDDETLLKVLQWNQFPDQYFTWNERIGLADGRVLNVSRIMMIGLNSPAAQLEPINPLRNVGGTPGREANPAKTGKAGD